MGKTQIGTILSEKINILLEFEKNGNVEKKKRFPKLETSVIDDIVYKWICQMRAKTMRIQQKAVEVAEAIGISNFSASNGRL